MLVKYLSKTRKYTYKGIVLEIPPQVFHPGFFSSTRLIWKYIDKIPLAGKTLLELGAGSGLIAMLAANKGAVVTASDINPVAVEYIRKNSSSNKIKIETIHSDLFENIPARRFDVIAINPPYYKKQPQTLLDHAWYCGENGEYFSRLFTQLAGYINKNSATIMVLCDGCDIAMIESAASVNGFHFQLMQTTQHMLEKNFIYKIEKER